MKTLKESILNPESRDNIKMEGTVRQKSEVVCLFVCSFFAGIPAPECHPVTSSFVTAILIGEV